MLNASGSTGSLHGSRIHEKTSENDANLKENAAGAEGTAAIPAKGDSPRGHAALAAMMFTAMIAGVTIGQLWEDHTTISLVTGALMAAAVTCFGLRTTGARTATDRERADEAEARLLKCEKVMAALVSRSELAEAARPLERGMPDQRRFDQRRFDHLDEMKGRRPPDAPGDGGTNSQHTIPAERRWETTRGVRRSRGRAGVREGSDAKHDRRRSGDYYWRTPSPPKRPKLCWNCGEAGHYARTCAQDSTPPSLAYMAKGGWEPDPSTAFLDSGASHHQAAREFMKRYSVGMPTERKTRINGVNIDAPIYSSLRAKMELPIGDPDGAVHVLKMDECLGGDDISGVTLISLGRLTAAGYTFILTSNDCFIFDDSLELVKTVKRNADHMYELDMEALGSAPREDSLPRENVEAVLERLNRDWRGKTETAKCFKGYSHISEVKQGDFLKAKHEMYGHVNVHSGKNFDRLKAIYGNKTARAIANVPCEACGLVSAHKWAKDCVVEHHRPANKFLDRWHIDLKVILGRIYLFVLDEGLNKGVALLLKNRAEAPDAFARYLAEELRHARFSQDRRVPTDAGGCGDDQGLRQVRMDDAREFTRGAMRELHSGEHIAREIRVAHDAAQSGIIERYAHIVADHAKKMVYAAGAPPELSVYAVKYFAEHIHPRLPWTARANKPIYGIGRDDEEYATAWEAYNGLKMDLAELDNGLLL
jgi:hypothetical protein